MGSPAGAAERLRSLAQELGFERLAVTTATPAREDGERLAQWAADGKAAGMEWLTRAPARRADPDAFSPGARSVVTLAVPYEGGPRPVCPGPEFGRVARYAWGRDYHAVVEARLGLFREALRREFGDGVFRPSVDAQPFMERAFARRAGLGFVGKNTCLIVPGVGSTLFLAELVVNIELPADGQVPQGCGACVQCAASCPTGALDTPFSLDARLCLAYHSVENRGSVPRALREKWGDWLFGCDDCQEVCPYNVRPGEVRWPELTAAQGPGAWVSLREVLRLRTPELFRARFSGTALLRAKRAGLVRNACLASAQPGTADAVRKELVTVLKEDSDAMVREHAAWALGRVGTPWARQALSAARSADPAPGVVQEIEQSLAGTP